MGLFKGPMTWKAILQSVSRAYGKNNCLGAIVRKEGQPDAIKYLTYN